MDADRCSAERLLAWSDIDLPDPDGACVVYWMARSQRGVRNLALDCAIAAARALNLPLVVVFELRADGDETQLRHVDWMLRGLGSAFADCAARGAHVALIGFDGPWIDELCSPGALHAALVITDDDVMHAARAKRARVASQLQVPLISVDADVVVPGAAFPKLEYAARTIRPKLHRVLAQFDGELGDGKRGPRAPELPAPAAALAGMRGVTMLKPGEPLDIDRLLAAAQAAGIGATAMPVKAASGRAAGLKRLRAFVANDGGLRGFDAARNKPELAATSQLSRFVRFGHLSPVEVVDAVRSSDAPEADIATFVEEFVVRRELAYNHVRWNPNAGTLASADAWALRTLTEHASDDRLWIWDDATLEAGDTHDPLWNAAQRQLVETGFMHGYVRMYWAKKMLEWRPDPAAAFDIALRLNDRWQLDGRDPNGIVGVAWAIAGVHDRAWTERPIFGKIRYMSLGSTGRKFDSRRYVAQWGGVRGAACSDPGRYADTPGVNSLF